MDNDNDITKPIAAPDILAKVFLGHGVRNVFVSPGSRNAPIIEALAAIPEFVVRVVVDERVAAFAALGFASASGEAVAIVCTSGTAGLNYSPALAEAYYRHIPLIAITADRPEEWINQDDSQTIVQPGIYHNFIKGTYDIPVMKMPRDVWHTNRLINEALVMATSRCRGPVHINMQIDQPSVSVEAPSYYLSRKVEISEPCGEIEASVIEALATVINSSGKVMIVAGFADPSRGLNAALSTLAQLPNIVVMTETISNLHSSRFLPCIDLTLRQISKRNCVDLCRPDVVISTGGAIVSRRIKGLLRQFHPKAHWHVGVNGRVIDCFGAITRIIETEPVLFFTQLALAVRCPKKSCDYADRWRLLYDAAQSQLQSYVDKIPWCDLKAFSHIIPAIPADWNVHFSNGTPIRYAQLFGNRRFHRCECNRGVSGIDGCTSTAVGASLAYKGVTLLVTGDTSALYDIGAFGSGLLDRRIKIIVIRNGGGGIFRFIPSTRGLAICEKFLTCDFKLPLRNICDGFGLEYFKASSLEELVGTLPEFIADASGACLLEVVTPSQLSADVLSQLLND